MTTPKKTGWFDSTTPPARIGGYEGNLPLIETVYWDGSRWSAYGMYIRGKFKWRGLAESPQSRAWIGGK